MSNTSRVYILKGIDAQETESLAKSVEYVFNRANIVSEVTIVNTLELTLESNDYVVLHIDQLSLNGVINNAKNQAFFTSKKYKNKQILLLIDDVDPLDLPDYMLYLPAFQVIIREESIDGEYVNVESVKKTALIRAVYDMVLYIKQVDSNVKNALTIYIGPSDDNTTEEYQKIIRELLHRNHNLVPKIINPSAKEVIEKPDLLSKMLDETDLCIHFVGHNSIQSFPEKISPALKINQLVANYCATNPKLQRIIYVPDENEETTEAIKQKISQFKSDLQALKNAELVQTPVEKLKHIVLGKIESVINPLLNSDNNEEDNDDVYLIFAPGYNEIAEPYISWFKSNEISYSVSQVNLDQLALLQYHQSKLRTARGVVIVNHGNNEWLDRKLSDLLKAPGWGRQKPFKFKIIVGTRNENSASYQNLNKSLEVLDAFKKESFDKLLPIIKN